MIETSRMTVTSVLLVLIPLIALLVGYMGIPAKARRRREQEANVGRKRYYN